MSKCPRGPHCFLFFPCRVSKWPPAKRKKHAQAQAGTSFHHHVFPPTALGRRKLCSSQIEAACLQGIPRERERWPLYAICLFWYGGLVVVSISQSVARVSLNLEKNKKNPIKQWKSRVKRNSSLLKKRLKYIRVLHELFLHSLHIQHHSWRRRWYKYSINVVCSGL